MYALMVCGTLMSYVDDSLPIPEPHVGENIIDYWVRVLQEQAVEQAKATR